MSKLIVSRSGHCQHCEKAGRPKKEDLYTLFGTQHQQFMVFVCEYDSPPSKYGFVPLLYEKIATQSLDSGVYVHYIRTCGICGVEVNYQQNKALDVIGTIQRISEGKPVKLYVQRLRWRKGMMPERQWNALVRDWKATGFELDDWKYH